MISQDDQDKNFRDALELANEKGSRKVTLNDAVTALLDSHDKAHRK